jgi:hypothetical protein
MEHAKDDQKPKQNGQENSLDIKVFLLSKKSA